MHSEVTESSLEVGNAENADPRSVDAEILLEAELEDLSIPPPKPYCQFRFPLHLNPVIRILVLPGSIPPAQNTNKTAFDTSINLLKGYHTQSRPFAYNGSCLYMEVTERYQVHVLSRRSTTPRIRITNLFRIDRVIADWECRT